MIVGQRIPFRETLLVALAAGLGYGFDAYAVNIFGILGPLLAKDLDITVKTIGRVCVDYRAALWLAVDIHFRDSAGPAGLRIALDNPQIGAFPAGHRRDRTTHAGTRRCCVAVAYFGRPRSPAIKSAGSPTRASRRRGDEQMSTSPWPRPACEDRH